MQEYFQHYSNVFLQLSETELFLHFRNVSTFWKCRNISYIFPMCFCSCQKLNCSCILKMQQCFLHFGNGGIFPAFSSKFLQLSKAELFLHFKNAEMFHILEMEEYFQQFFKCISAVEAVSMKTGICFELSTPSILFLIVDTYKYNFI